MLIIEPTTVIIFWALNPIPIEHMPFWYPVLGATTNHTLLKYRYLNKKKKLNKGFLHVLSNRPTPLEEIRQIYCFGRFANFSNNIGQSTRIIMLVAELTWQETHIPIKLEWFNQNFNHAHVPNLKRFHHKRVISRYDQTKVVARTIKTKLSTLKEGKD